MVEGFSVNGASTLVTGAALHGMRRTHLPPVLIGVTLTHKLRHKVGLCCGAGGQGGGQCAGLLLLQAAAGGDWHCDRARLRLPAGANGAFLQPAYPDLGFLGCSLSVAPGFVFSH